MNKNKIAFIALLAVVCLTTLFVRIPLPTRGYFNVGDIAVIFAGLVLGSMDRKSGCYLAFLAGGIGAAMADVIGGFAMFAPITLMAKGLEGLVAGMAAGRNNMMQYFLLGLAGTVMVLTYFAGELLLPSIGLQGAVAEILPNVIQAVGGIIGGRFAFAAYQKIAVHRHA